MYLFSRTRTAHPGHFTAALTFATEITATASAVTGLEISAWTSVMSPSAGEIAWTAFFETLADWEVATDKLGADATYNSAVENADGLFMGPVIDQMASLLSPLPEGEPDATYVSVVTAVAANGHIGAAVQHGLAIATAATELGGVATSFALATTGAYGGVSWFTGAPTIAALEAAANAINADPAFLELVDSGGDLFQTGATQTMYRRIA
jgi:autotransporter adhesin